MADDAKALGSLTALTIHIDRENQVHAFADPHAQWKLLTPLSIEALIAKYNDLIEDAGEGLTTLAIHVDHEGQVHAYTTAHATWRFLTPIPVRELVENYLDVLANVVIELKANHTTPRRDARDRSQSRRRR